MKLLAELHSLIKPSSTDKGAVEMKYPNVYKEKKGIGGKKKVRKETVVVRDTNTGKVYGRRTVYQKPSS